MAFSLERWSGKVAVVTGASAGIGAAIAEKLVENGLKVVGLARRVELIENHAKELANKPGKLYGVKADICNEDEVINAFKWITENLGPVHILVNNAAVAIPGSNIESPVEDWRKIFEVNVLGLCITTKEAIKLIRVQIFR